MIKKLVAAVEHVYKYVLNIVSLCSQTKKDSTILLLT